MWVWMIEGISGGRSDGRPWPPKGGRIDVPDGEGADLIRSGLAVLATPPPPPPQLEAIEETAPTVAEALTTVSPTEDDLAVPTPSDPKSAWVTYAVSQGSSEAEAENLTKTQLQAAFGGRLL